MAKNCNVNPIEDFELIIHIIYGQSNLNILVMLNDEAGGLSLNGLLATAKNKQTKNPTTVIVGIFCNVTRWAKQLMDVCVQQPVIHPGLKISTGSR